MTKKDNIVKVIVTLVLDSDRRMTQLNSPANIMALKELISNSFGFESSNERFSIHFYNEKEEKFNITNDIELETFILLNTRQQIVPEFHIQRLPLISTTGSTDQEEMKFFISSEKDTQSDNDSTSASAFFQSIFEKPINEMKEDDIGNHHNGVYPDFFDDDLVKILKSRLY